MKAENRQTARRSGWPIALAGLAMVVLMPVAAGAQAATSDVPAIEVNPKALEAVPKPAPPEQPKKQETPAPEKQAALPSGSAKAADEALKKLENRHETVLFDPKQDALSAEAIEKLSTLATDMTGNGTRIELSAYAGTKDESLSDANRLALKHALLVRDYLIGKGIAESRVIVRALGPAPSGPTDRVDIAFLTQ